MFEEMFKGRGSKKHIFGNLGVTQRFFYQKGSERQKRLRKTFCQNSLIQIWSHQPKYYNISDHIKQLPLYDKL
jgi:hypothetical protein